jgi:hypothetical protein
MPTDVPVTICWHAASEATSQSLQAEKKDQWPWSCETPSALSHSKILNEDEGMTSKLLALSVIRAKYSQDLQSQCTSTSHGKVRLSEVDKSPAIS